MTQSCQEGGSSVARKRLGMWCAVSPCLDAQELEGANLDVAMAQHLLVAADRFQLSRLRRICERRLCETVEVILLFLPLSLGMV